MNNDTGATLIHSYQWRQFLDSTAAALQLDLVFVISDIESYTAVCDNCPVSKIDIGSFNVEKNLHTERLYNNPEDEVDSQDNVNQMSFKLKNDTVVIARRYRHCKADMIMTFHESVSIAKQLLVSFLDIMMENWNGDSNRLSSLRQLNHIILSLFRGENKALDHALYMILSAAIILFDASGSWFEYIDGCKRNILSKGNCSSQADIWSRSDRDFVRAVVESPNVQGQICIESPADIRLTETFLNLIVQECILVFEVDLLMRLMEARNDLILGTIGSAVLLIGSSRVICYANSSAGDMLRLTKTGWQGYPIDRITAPWNECILNKTDKPVKGIKDKLFDRYINWSVFPMKESEVVVGWILIADDCTDYYHMQEIEQKAEVMVNTSMLLRSLAHEIRNPLATLRGILQLILQNEESDEAVKYLERGIKEVDRVTKLMNDFLQMRKPPDFSNEPIDLNSYLEDLMPILNSMLTGKSMKIITNFNKITPIPVDSEQLTQVLINVIKNAIEALGENGYITISLREIINEWTEILIRDTGSGLTPDVKDRLFEPYFSTKDGGTGLGLSICKAIIHNNGGEISALSHPEGGALFSILLPTKAYDRNENTKIDMMLVTCDEMIRIPTEQVMISESLIMLAVTTLENAVFLLSRYHFALIVIDSLTLDISSYYNFRKSYPSINIIIIGYEDPGREYKDVYYIPKPLNYSRFVSIVKRLVSDDIIELN